MGGYQLLQSYHPSGVDQGILSAETGGSPQKQKYHQSIPTKCALLPDQQTLALGYPELNYHWNPIEPLLS